jgi:CheY-like chemotaxis protein
MSPERTHVVVVNDNPEFLELMADILRDEHYPATVIDGDRDDAVDLIRAAVPDLLIIDLRLGRDELHGWDILKQIRTDANLAEVPTIICTGDVEAAESVAEALRDMRRVETLLKPFTIDALLSKIERLTSREPA